MNAQGLWVLGRLPKPLRLDALRDLLQTYQREVGGRVEHRFDVVEQRPLEEIVDALNSRAFEPFFQPRVSLARSNVVGAEALARWNHPELGLISPAAFIPAIEHAGYGDTLTDIMLDKSLGYAKRWLDHGLDTRRFGELSRGVDAGFGSAREDRRKAGRPMVCLPRRLSSR